MGKYNSLVGRIKDYSYDWKDWIPGAGLYFILRNLNKVKDSSWVDAYYAFNGIYHGFVTALPLLVGAVEVLNRDYFK